MVRVNLTRESFEVIAATTPHLGVTRQHAEVLADADEAGGGERVNLTRMSFEVLIKSPGKVSVTRQHAEVLADADGAGGGERVNLTKMSYETIAALIKKIAVTRQHAEVLADADAANGERVNLTRISFEVMSRKGPAPVVPLALADEVDLFMHNWADAIGLESGWITDLQYSAVNGGEERRGLSQKPLRTMTLSWLIDSREEADRMLVLLRRIAKTRFQVPLYMDQTALTTGSSSGTNILYLDTTKARFFSGARIVIVKKGTGATPVAFEYAQISTRTTSSITLTSNLVSSVDTSYVVIPMIDCELMLQPSMVFSKAYGATVKLTVTEVPGASQLPARGSDYPLGYPVFESRPVFNIEPNWINGLDVGVDRQGEKYNTGRAQNTYTVGDRGRRTTSFFLTVERNDNAFSLIEFFETRRGRLRSFWLIDQDQVWQTVAISSPFIDIDPLGSFDEFQEELEYVGIVMNDGTVYIREVVTIQDTLGVWRLTSATALPSINVANIRRIARARLVRFDSDAMTETWVTDNAMTTRADIIECLREEDVEL